ncbi:hypothetical protein C3942_00275 [Solimonas fluminis]|uniref:DUF2207 domain-containing protein n=1 Tax=Solimonas fluminis TaxID=2086571 RepID=A0A2S5TKA6_9GAMM|nr:hypothetical protein [Solimonas fluminis]PPE75372.1 hypothetical protein C3942_00275 [Solimonas fluminis]
MRTWIISAAAAALFATAGSAAAADYNDKQPEFKAYFDLKFDGRGSDAQQLNYGLRMDHDRRFLEAPRPAIAQLDFRAGKQAGLEKFELNGAPLVERKAELNQDGEVQYGTIDWALIAAAVVGVGWIAYETFDNDESPSPPKPDPENPPPTGGPQLPGTVGELIGLVPGLGDILAPYVEGGLDTILSLPANTPLAGLVDLVDGGLNTVVRELLPFLPGSSLADESRLKAEIERHTPAYQAWLDGGTGHMGDLLSAH